MMPADLGALPLQAVANPLQIFYIALLIMPLLWGTIPCRRDV
jgi:hypothetical protein